MAATPASMYKINWDIAVDKAPRRIGIGALLHGIIQAYLATIFHGFPSKQLLSTAFRL
jgi:hypothetical protein